jgi:hypothetical protein
MPVSGDTRNVRFRTFRVNNVLFQSRAWTSVIALLALTHMGRAQSPQDLNDGVRKAFEFSVLEAKASIALKDRSFNLAHDYYGQALKVCSAWDSYTLISASLAAYKTGEPGEAWSVLSRAIATGATWGDIEEKVFEVDSLAIGHFATAYKAIAPAAITEFAHSVDFESYTVIRDIFTADQCIRNVPYKAVRDTAFLKYMGIQDSVRFIQLVELVEIKGWPTFERIGNLNSLLPLLLMHNIGVPYATDTHWMIIRNAIHQEVVNGNEDGYVLALLEDIILRRSEQPQRYGTESDGWDSTPTYYAIDSCATVDERRREIGMIPLALDAQKRGLQLPACYAKAK